jgi:hypothetical protein
VYSWAVQITDYRVDRHISISFDESRPQYAIEMSSEETMNDATWDVWLTGDSITLLVAFIGWLYPFWYYPRWLTCLLLYLLFVHLGVTVLCAQLMNISDQSYVLSMGILLGTLLFFMTCCPLICVCGDLPTIHTILTCVVVLICPLLILLCITEMTRTGSNPDFQTFVFLDQQFPEWPVLWVLMLPFRAFPVWLRNQI